MVGGELTSMAGDEGCDDVAITSIQDMGAVGTGEVRTFVPCFQRDQLWIVGEQVDVSSYNFYYT